MKHFRHAFTAMASPCEVQGWAADDRDALRWVAVAVEEIRRIEKKYSRYLADSTLSKINASAGAATIAVDDETASLLNYGAACFDASNGRFDVTSGVLRRAWNFKSSAPQVPNQSAINALLPLIGWQKVGWRAPMLRLPAKMEIDFGGIAKEYASDRAAMLCEAAGAQALLVNCGGDLRAIGPQPQDQPWRIGISHPREMDKTIASLPLLRGGLATSGDYERYIEIGGVRYCHILDAKSGWPVPAAQIAQSVSVSAPACMVAGSVSTIAMLSGASAHATLDAAGFSYLLVDANGVVQQRS